MLKSKSARRRLAKFNNVVRSSTRINPWALELRELEDEQRIEQRRAERKALRKARSVRPQ